jgi:Enoyl-[acyl-carrier-protein] reductase (NADH)
MLAITLTYPTGGALVTGAGRSDRRAAKQIMEMVPRPTTLEEAGDLFANLASDQASYVTGQSILLDYGATL